MGIKEHLEIKARLDALEEKFAKLKKELEKRQDKKKKKEEK